MNVHNKAGIPLYHEEELYRSSRRDKPINYQVEALNKLQAARMMVFEIRD